MTTIDAAQYGAILDLIGTLSLLIAATLWIAYLLYITRNR